MDTCIKFYEWDKATTFVRSLVHSPDVRQDQITIFADHVIIKGKLVSTDVRLRKVRNYGWMTNEIRGRTWSTNSSHVDISKSNFKVCFPTP